MKKLLAILILLYHVNFFMFIPQLDEVDQYDSKGMPIDDINSLTGYIDQTILGHKHSSPQDEDDDNARYFQLIDVNGYNFQQQIIESIQGHFIPANKTRYPSTIEKKICTVHRDITTPPPRYLYLS
ncbi:MAG: hypothetical protein ACXVLT_09290 [Flavisolibacter sp.]